MDTASSIRINPAVLKWVMENEGWEADELAKETNLSASQIRRWASVESDIAIRDLRRMSAKFKRPMSVLYMAEAPKVTVPPHYRHGGEGGRAATKPSRGALDVIRKARYVQGNAADMLREMGRSADAGVFKATTAQSPASAAALNAEALGIEPPRRKGSGESRDRQRYSDIRDKIESRNVFTMQEAIPAEDKVSGFALVCPAPAVILVNSRDTIRRRIFTLLHEYAHVILSHDGICGAGSEPPGSGGTGAPDIERWCDGFAGATLMPRNEFRNALEEERSVDRGDEEPLQVVNSLADRFCVSRIAALVRIMEMLGGDSVKTKYSRCYNHLKRGAATVKNIAKDSDASGGPSQATLCLTRKGRKYARLVFDAEESGIITTSTALGHLNIKIKHLDEVMAKCGED